MNAPTRPDLPIDTRTRSAWIERYRNDLEMWWRVYRGHRIPTQAEWAEFACLMWDAQVKYEDELVMGQAW